MNGPHCRLTDLVMLKNFSALQQISIGLAILVILFFFALQIPWVAAWFG